MEQSRYIQLAENIQPITGGWVLTPMLSKALDGIPIKTIGNWIRVENWIGIRLPAFIYANVYFMKKSDILWYLEYYHEQGRPSMRHKQEYQTMKRALQAEYNRRMEELKYEFNR